MLANTNIQKSNLLKWVFSISFILISCQINLNAQWIQTNGPEGGDVRAIVWDNVNIYVGLSVGGIQISSDNGNSWTLSNSGLPVPVGVQAMLVKDQYIFAGLLNWRVFVSSDHGQTWAEANNGLPNLTINVFAEADSFIFLGTAATGIFRSSNYGANWHLKSSGLTNGDIKAFATRDSIIFAGTKNGVFKSTNYGDNWIEKSNGLTSKYINDLTTLNNYIAAVTQDGVFISTDDGDNWQPVGFQGLNLLSLTAVDSVLFAGTFSSGVYYSSDYGANWLQFNDGYPSHVITTLLETKGDQVLAGNELGIYGVKLSDPAWTDMNNGLLGISTNCFAVKDSILIAGTNSGGVFLSSDYGENWISRRIEYGYNGPVEFEFQGDSLYALCSSGLFVSDDLGMNWDQFYIPTQFFTALAVRGDNIFVGTDQAGIWLSTNGGLNWTQVNSGLTSLFIKAIAIDDSNVYAGTFDGLFISSDNGENWVVAGSGIPQTFSPETINIIDDNIYAAGIYGIYLSTNKGNSWTYKGFGNDMVESIAGYGDIVFASVLDYYDGGIFYSTNRGSVWHEYNTGLPFYYSFALAIADTTLFAGISGHSVWKRSSIVTDVSDWKEFTPTEFTLYQNYPNPFNPVTKIRYTIPSSPQLPTYQGGEAKQGWFVQLKIYDVLGNEVATLVNEEKPAGNYEVDFDATGLPSGVYFYRLEVTGAGVNSGNVLAKTKKMILLK